MDKSQGKVFRARFSMDQPQGKVFCGPVTGQGFQRTSHRARFSVTVQFSMDQQHTVLRFIKNGQENEG